MELRSADPQKFSKVGAYETSRPKIGHRLVLGDVCSSANAALEFTRIGLLIHDNILYTVL